MGGLDESLRKAIIEVLERNLNLTKRMLKSLRCKRAPLLEMMSIVGESVQVAYYMSEVLGEWEALEAYIEKYVEAAYYRDMSVMRRYDHTLQLELVKRASLKTQEMTQFVVSVLEIQKKQTGMK